MAGLIAASEAEGAADTVLLGASATNAVMVRAPCYTEEDRGLILAYDNKFSVASWKPWLTYDAQASADHLSKPISISTTVTGRGDHRCRRDCQVSGCLKAMRLPPVFHRAFELGGSTASPPSNRPTVIRAFMGAGRRIPDGYDLSSLRLLGTVGEPINPEAWMWYRDVIGSGRCPVLDTW